MFTRTLSIHSFVAAPSHGASTSQAHRRDKIAPLRPHRAPAHHLQVSRKRQHSVFVCPTHFQNGRGWRCAPHRPFSTWWSALPFPPHPPRSRGQALALSPRGEGGGKSRILPFFRGLVHPNVKHLFLCSRAISWRPARQARRRDEIVQLRPHGAQSWNSNDPTDMPKG